MLVEIGKESLQFDRDWDLVWDLEETGDVIDGLPAG